MLFDLTILLLGAYITDTFTHMHTQLCTAVFVAAFFLQQRMESSSTDGGLARYTVEQRTATERNRAPPDVPPGSDCQHAKGFKTKL